MSTHIALIIGLCLVFLIGTALPVNVGAVAFVAAFVVGTTFAGLSSTAILAGFPGDLLVTLVGITYLFAIAQSNGTVDLLVRGAVRIVRGHTAILPWVFFCVTALITGIGAVSPGAVAIIAPVALRFAHQHRINPLLMGLMVIHGAQAGGFSPLSIYGGITNQVMVRANLPADEMYLFLASLGFNVLAATVIYLLLGVRRHAPRSEASRQVEVEQSQPAPPALTGRVLVTLIGICALGVGGVAFELNVGLVSMSIAVLLTILFPREHKQAIDKVPWSTVFLVCGVVTYVGVLQRSGTIDFVGNSVSALGSPIFGALLLCYVGGVVSAFASTVGVLGAIIPLAVPLLVLGGADAVSVVSALAISSSVVDVSPFSTNGALVVASAEEADRSSLYRRLLAYSMSVVALAPLLAWLLLVLPAT